jgi:hypothetical protein
MSTFEKLGRVFSWPIYFFNFYYSPALASNEQVATNLSKNI